METYLILGISHGECLLHEAWVKTRVGQHRIPFPREHFHRGPAIYD